MRIAIDGAAGSGKSTFLGTKYFDEIGGKIPNIRDLGYEVFSELIRGSLDRGEQLNICPPKNMNDWTQLFEIMFNTAKTQYENGSGREIFWYDRGMPFISVFANAHNVSVASEMYKAFSKYIYDYVFIFKPIESFDLSIKAKGKLKSLTLEDRYVEFERTCKIYKDLGHTVYEVPVFSDDLIINFNRRYEYIRSIVLELNS